MSIWISKNIKDKERYNFHRPTGLRRRFSEDVDPEVRRACTTFCNWLSMEYLFPVRVTVYFEGTKTVTAAAGDEVSGLYIMPVHPHELPRCRVAVGDYPYLLERLTRDHALAAILETVAHELTHYYQWVQICRWPLFVREWHARKTANSIVRTYAKTRDHP